MTVAPLTAPLSEGALIQAAIFRFEPGGQLRRHSAGAFPQILAVLEGLGEVSGADGVDEEIHAGEAVFWYPGEEHGTKSQGGLTALIIEGESRIGSEHARRQGGIGVYARATTYRGAPEEVQDAIVHYQEGVPSIREISGNRGAFLLVDRSAGRGSALRSGRAKKRCEQAASARTSSASRRRNQAARSIRWTNTRSPSGQLADASPARRRRRQGSDARVQTRRPSVRFTSR